MVELRRLEIAAPGLSSPLVLNSGSLDGSIKIERRGGLVRASQSKTAAGYSVTSRTPDLYEYDVSVWLTKPDLVKFERILLAQQATPLAVQYVDVMEPISIERITASPQRTAYGPVESSAEGDRQNFQSFCSVFNTTPSEEVISADGGECRYLVEFRLEENR